MMNDRERIARNFAISQAMMRNTNARGRRPKVERDVIRIVDRVRSIGR